MTVTTNKNYKKTFTKVATQTLTSTSSTVTFSNIPQNYTDLRIVISGNQYTSASYGAYRLRFNSDSGTNYSSTYIYGDGTTAYSARATSATSGTSAGLVTTTLGGSQFTLHLMNYSNSTTYKTILARGSEPSGVGGYNATATVNLWRNTAPITTITLAIGGGFPDFSFISGSTFSLYGIQAGTPKAQGGQIVTTDGTY